MTPATLKVRHIGQHAKRADTMTGTGTIWYGYGDIKEVPAKDWDKLKRHPDLWELVDEGGGGPTLGDAASDELDAMERDDLYALAVQRELEPHPKLGKPKLLELLRSAKA